jgi:hypothetical protein
MTGASCEQQIDFLVAILHWEKELWGGGGGGGPTHPCEGGVAFCLGGPTHPLGGGGTDGRGD